MPSNPVVSEPSGLSLSLTYSHPAAPYWYSFTTTTYESLAGQYTFDVVATDANSGLTATFSMTLYNCSPVVTVSQANIPVSPAGTSITWSTSNNSLCGSYTATATDTINYTFTISGNQISIGVPSSATAGTYSAQFKVTRDSNANFWYDKPITLIVSTCGPTGLALTPSIVYVSILGPTATSTWSMTANDASCGSYTASATSTNDYVINISGNTLTISAPATATQSTYTPAITISNADNSATGNINLSIRVWPCQATAFSYTSGAITNQSIELHSSFTGINF